MTSHASPARRRRVWILALLLVALVVVLFWPQAFNLHYRASATNTWLLFLTSTLSFLGTVILTLILARQVVKLYAERRANVLGAQFRTKLVIGALALSLTPVLCMFAFTYGLINRTLDKWFSQPVVDVRDANQGLLDLLTSFVGKNAVEEARTLAADPGLAAAAQRQDWRAAQAALVRHQPLIGGSFAALLDASGAVRARIGLPPPNFSPAVAAPSAQFGRQTYLLTRAPLARGQLELAVPLPQALSAQLARLALARDRYDRLARQNRSLKLLYTGYLLLLTLAILFGATWLALYLSRHVTLPMAELAQGTREISSGNLAYRVHVPPAAGKDEIGEVLDSFNRMASELEANRAQIETSRRELEARRQYTETLLEHTPSAVISLDAEHRIERINPAVPRLFGPGREHPRRLEDLFDAASLREIHHLLRKSERWPAASGQLEVAAGGARQLTLAATVAAIPAGPPAAAAGERRPRRRPWAGYVLVLEDLTDLLRIQKTAAWREVAQRIAHEIKNPLTPIALSAQRIRRRLSGLAPGAEIPAVIAECTATIEAEVRSLERLVEEFAAFARFPHAQPVPSDLNDIIERSLRAFDGRLEGIEIRTHFDPLPPLALDPEDVKRVFINIIDNAAEAMRASPYRQLTIATQRLDGSIEAVVADTGRGLPPGDKQRLFLPYVSTKARGTGLGLAIAQRILEESGGSIRAEDNAPLGARFIVEFPFPD
jgi:two-component system nitrogen regulation sensor histidine kinase NtrY